ncbi:SCO family protein [Xanthomonas populi]|uniref:SCO family protein n=1 Tax=Xanthomonas populi TaxID=53414 RepID=A0A2S7E3K4_9XANT|nr:SCO family protein [Xanthomonas populi]PPU82993.1 SCO family protein [Xanthomonas populi]
MQEKIVRLKRVTSRLVLLCAVCVMAGCGLWGSSFSPNGADLSGMGRGVDFYLRDTEGKPKPLRSFHGKALVLLFGFTNCPDVCPTALARAAQVKRKLGAQASQVQFAFATLDPQRDVPNVLRTYVKEFDPDFIALTGSTGEIRVAADNLKVVYAKVPRGKTYTIDHSTRSFVFDRNGNLRVGFAHEQSVDSTVEDIRQVIALE